MSQRVLIVGAGLAGLSAARRLVEADQTVLVLDKGRRPGGRLSSRPVDGVMFNHGAQFFTARSAEFIRLVDGWCERGIAREWTRGFQRVDGHPRYVGVPSMNAIAADLATGLDVQCGVELTSLWPQAEGFDAILLTPPVPQSLALTGLDLPELRGIVYDRCIALMVTGAVCALPETGALQLPDGEPISWIADEHSRAGQPSNGARPVMIHSGPAFALEYWDRPHGEAAAALLAAAGIREYTSWHYHRWKFAKPTQLHPEPFLRAVIDRPEGGAPLPLYFAGDAFGEARVEGAVRSGWAAAEAILAERP